MAWISWNKALASKKKGGLGVSSFFALNRAMMFKWVWRFISQGSSLWARFIKAIHGIRGAIDCPGYSSRYFPWLDIIRELSSLKGKGIDLMSFVIKKVGNGEDTLFWDEVWLGETLLKHQYPRLYALETSKQISVAEKLRHVSLDFSYHRSPRGGVEEEQQSALHSQLADLILPHMQDRCSDDVPTRWVKVIPMKVNVFAWRVSMDKLPTRLNLSLKGLEITNILCPFCNVVVESVSHLLFSCSLARQVMSKVLCWWDLDATDLSSYDEWLLWFQNIRMSKSLKAVFEGVCYVMWWFLWNFRNQMVFSIFHSRKETLFDDIVQLSFTWCSSRCKSKFDWVTWMQNPSIISM